MPHNPKDLPSRADELEQHTPTAPKPQTSVPDVLLARLAEAIDVDRDPHVDTWPEDEQLVYREGPWLSQTDRLAALDRIVHRKAAAAVLAALADAGYIVIPAPTFAYKGPGETDVARAREVADSIASNVLPGSNSCATTALLLRAAADAMEAEGLATQPFAAEALQYGLRNNETGSVYEAPTPARARDLIDGKVEHPGLTVVHRVVGPWVETRRA